MHQYYKRRLTIATIISFNLVILFATFQQYMLLSSFWHKFEDFSIHYTNIQPSHFALNYIAFFYFEFKTQVLKKAFKLWDGHLYMYLTLVHVYI